MPIRYLSGLSVDSTVLVVDAANDRVGIGTASPSVLLDVYNSSGWGGIDIDGTSGGEIRLQKNGTTYGNLYASDNSSTAFVINAAQANDLILQTNSSERLRITSAGNVGIGTTAPGARLHSVADTSSDDAAAIIQGTGALGSGLHLQASGTSGRTWRLISTGTSSTPGAGTLGFYDGTAGLYRFVINTSGNVGIGTTAPGAKLEVKPSGDGDIFIGRYSGGSAKLIYAYQSSADGFLELRTGADTIVTKLSGYSGTPSYFLSNVGIGTTSPAYKLDVQGSAGNIARITDGTSHFLFYAGSGLNEIATTGPFLFTVSGSERMRITSAGNVGIGNTNPTAKLQVGAEAHSNATGIEVAAGAGGANLLALDSSTNHNWFPYTDGSNYYSAVSHTFRNELHSTDWMKITSAGNVGIGTTAPNFLLTLDKNSSYTLGLLNSNIGTPGQYTGLTFGYTGTTYQKGAVYFISKDANGVGDLVFALNNVASSANVSTSDERVRITSAGNVGIGTTSPTAKLQITSTSAGAATVAAFLVNESVTTSTEVRLAFAANTNNDIASNRYSYISALNTSGSNGQALIFATNETANSAVERLRIASTGAATFSSSVTASSLIKSGGTASQYLMADGSVSTLTNPVTGTGTTNYVPKWTSGSAIGDSSIYDNGTSVGVNTNAFPANTYRFAVKQGTNRNLGIAEQDGELSIEAYNDALNAGVPLRIYSSKTQFLNGNVGIGTTSPVAKLTVVGAATVIGQTNVVARFSDDINSTLLISHPASTSATATITGNEQLGFATGSVGNIAERMRITSGGNVGIGTTSPANKLVVTSDASPTSENSYSIAAASASDPAYKTVIGYDFTNDIGLIAAVRTGIGWRNISMPQGSLGLGNIAPTEKLHVTGNIRVTGAYYDSSNDAGSSGQVLSSTGSGTDWITPATTTATSLYDLLPAGRVAYNWVGQVVNDTWTTVFSKNDSILTTGTWMVKMYVNDFGVGGGHYQYVYSGIMTWDQGTVNQTGEAAFSEVYLHRMGHAANASVVYLRTAESGAAGGNIGYFQIKGNYSNTSNQTIQFQFVKIF